jgi:hypothetical protein
MITPPSALARHRGVGRIIRLLPLCPLFGLPQTEAVQTSGFRTCLLGAIIRVESGKRSLVTQLTTFEPILEFS